jgi:hypothetical protein
MLLRLRDSARQRARASAAKTRSAKRRRRALEALARTWQELANDVLHGDGN